MDNLQILETLETFDFSARLDALIEGNLKANVSVEGIIKELKIEIKRLENKQRSAA